MASRQGSDADGDIQAEGGQPEELDKQLREAIPTEVEGQMNIRKLTCLIVHKGNLFLSGYDKWWGIPLWSTSRYDAWRTRNRDDAKRVAEKLGAEIALFNPASGDIEMATNRLGVDQDA